MPAAKIGDNVRHTVGISELLIRIVADVEELSVAFSGNDQLAVSVTKGMPPFMAM